MKARLAAGLILLLVGIPAAAHRLDEYLQATLISVGKDRIHAQIRLIPGIAVFPLVIAAIDTNDDGAIGEAEQQSYVQRVLSDLSLAIDGSPVRLLLEASKFATVADMKAGLGEIQLELSADVPRGGAERKLVFENRHESPIAAYLVNVLVPRDSGIRVVEQKRNFQQSLYQLNYMQAGSGPLFLSWWSGVRGLLVGAVLFMFAWPTLLWRRRSCKPLFLREY